MAIQLLLAPALAWVFRDVIVKFMVFTALFAVVAFFVPTAANYVLKVINIPSLNSAFAALPPGVWWFIDIFRLDFGLPFCLTAFLYRFLIRRLPVIG